MLDVANYSVRDVANMTGKTVESVRNWIRNGQLKARKPPGCRDYIIRKADFDLFYYGDAVECTVKSVAPQYP